MKHLKHGWDRFRPYRRGDLSRVWANLRDEDRTELTTSGFLDPDVLEDILSLEACKVKTWDTEVGPVAALGVTRTDDPQVGLIWALASKLAVPRWRFAVRNTEAVLNELGEGFLVLANFKDSRNRQQINWLKRVGFTFINTHEGDGATYHEFVRINQ